MSNKLLYQNELYAGNFSLNYFDGLNIGAITTFAGDIIPNGYLECDGREISRANYHALFLVVGEKYGAGDGSTTFNIPAIIDYTAPKLKYLIKAELGDTSINNASSTRRGFVRFATDDEALHSVREDIAINAKQLKLTVPKTDEKNKIYGTDETGRQKLFSTDDFDVSIISDDESKKLSLLNESKYNIDKCKVFNLSGAETHLLFKGGLKTPKTDIEKEAFNVLELPHNNNINYPSQIMVQTTSPAGIRTDLEQKSRFYDPTGDSYIDKSLIRNKKFSIRTWKPVDAKTTEYYDSRGNKVLAAEVSEIIELNFGETKTIYLSDMSDEDKGKIDGAKAYTFGDLTGFKVFDIDGNVAYQSGSQIPLAKIKAKEITINEDFIYYSLLHKAGCNVNELGQVSNFNLKSDSDFTFAVDSSLTDLNVIEVDDGGLPKTPYGFMGEVNIQPIEYEESSQQIPSILQKINATYKLTTDADIVEDKEYYILVGSDYVKVDNPVIEDISTYYEIDIPSTYKLWVSGSQVIKDVFVSLIF